jgi:DNA-binding MarR family transcriptional regulator
VARGSYKQTLEEQKTRSTLQLLFKCARLLNERAIEHVRQQTGLPLRAAHTTLLPHVDLEGTRLTDLAARLGVTKQGAGQLVDELVDMGMLERVTDPDDGRAKRVRFTKRGRAGLLHGLGTLQSIEAELRAQVGATTMRSLHDALVAIIRVIGEDPSAPAGG